MMDVEKMSVEDAAVRLKEEETEIFRAKCKLAAAAIPCGYGNFLAETWACSAQYVNTLAQIAQVFPPEQIHPAFPLSLYRAALDTGSPLVWLGRALDEGWSSRQLRDAPDVAKGRRESRVSWLKCRASP